MKSILVISKELKVSQTIKSCFPSEFRIESAQTKNDALNWLQKNRYDLSFIDLDILLEDVSDDDYSSALQLFWKLYPSIEIIVMAQQDRLRKAVMAVKAG
jgi:DNA-binding NtrC family response regulator